MKESIINKKIDYNVNINNFEGPLDLLLYLICKNKMNIFEISLSELTDKYIEYLSMMKSLDVEVATEFLVMASMLLEIKSRKLLPEVKTNDDDEILTEEEMVIKLIEYKKYKELSLYINKKYSENFGRFSKSPENIKFDIKKEYKGEKFYSDKIKEIYLSIILKNRNKINNKAKEIEKIALYERITVKEKTEQIVEYLKNNKQFVFNDMFKISTDNNLEVVTAFLGTLELSKEKQVTLSQEELFSDIYVIRNEEINL